jgi:hypothetical protein
MPRGTVFLPKIIQITASSFTDPGIESSTEIFALDNEGEIYMGYWLHGLFTWRKMPSPVDSKTANDFKWERVDECQTWTG